MRHHHSVHHLAVHRGLVPAVEQASLVNLAGNLICLHSVAGGSKDIHYGFLNLHSNFMMI